MYTNAKNVIQGLARIQGLRLQDVHEKANRKKAELGLKTSTKQVTSKKLTDGTMRLSEFELFLDVLGYEIEIVKKKDRDSNIVTDKEVIIKG